MDNHGLYLDIDHSGIKGMRWGVRRYQNKDGSLTPAGKKRYASEMGKIRTEKKNLKTAQATKAKIDKLNAERDDLARQKKGLSSKVESEVKVSGTKKSIKDMSDAELNSAISRMNLEKQYKSLMTELHPDKKKKGKEFVETVLTRSGENLMTQVVNHFGSKALNKLINSAGLGDSDDKGNPIDVIFANNKKK